MASLTDLVANLKLNAADFVQGLEQALAKFTAVAGSMVSTGSMISSKAVTPLEDLRAAATNAAKGIEIVVQKFSSAASSIVSGGTQIQSGGVVPLNELSAAAQLLQLKVSGASTAYSDASNKLRDSLGRFVGGKKDLEDAGNAAERTSGQFQKATGGFTAMLDYASSVIGRLAMGGAVLSASVTAPIMALGTAAMQMAGQFQSAEIGFTTMLGSAEMAGAFLDDLKKFAAQTPFEFPELLQSAKRLQALGFQAQDVVPMLRAVGDAVAGLGGGAPLIDRITLALGQMRAKGKVSAEEMRQLAEAGIPAWQALADKIGKSVPEAMKLAEKGALTAAEAIPAIIQGMNERFGGMMENFAQTAMGQFSNLKDQMSFVLADIGKSLLPLASLLLEKVLLPAGALIKKLAGMFAELPEPIKLAVIALAGLAAAIGPALLGLAGLATSLSSIGGLLGVSGAGAALAALAPILGYVAAGVAAVAAAWSLWNLEPVQRVVKSIWETLQAFWTETLKPFGESVIAAGEAFSRMASNMLASNIDSLMKSLKELWDALVASFGELGSATVELVVAFKELFTAVRPLIGPFVELLSPVVALLAAFGSVGIVKAFAAVIDSFTLAVKGGVLWVEIISSQIKVLSEDAKNAAAFFQTYLGPAINFVTNALKENFRVLASIPGVKQAIEALGGTFENLKNSIATTFADNSAAAGSFGKQTVDALHQTKAAADAAQKAFDEVRAKFHAGKASAEEFGAASEKLKNAQAAFNAELVKSGMTFDGVKAKVNDARKELDAANKNLTETEEKFRKGAATAEQLQAAQVKLTEAQKHWKSATTDAKTASELLNKSMMDFLGVSQETGKQTKSLEDQHKALVEAVKQAKAQYEAVFQQFIAGKATTEQLTAAYTKLITAQDAADPSRVSERWSKGIAEMEKRNDDLEKSIASLITRAGELGIAFNPEMFSKTLSGMFDIKDLDTLMQKPLQTIKEVLETLIKNSEATKAWNQSVTQLAGTFDTATKQINAKATEQIKITVDLVKRIPESVKQAIADAANNPELSKNLNENVQQVARAAKALEEAYKHMGLQTAGQLNDTVVKNREAYLKILNDASSSDTARLQSWIKLETSRQALAIATGKIISEAEKQALKEAIDNIEELTGRQKTAYEQLGMKSQAELNKTVEKNREAYERIVEDAGENSVAALQAWIIYETGRQDAARRSGEGISRAEERRLEKAQEQLDRAIGKQKSSWEKFTNQVSTIINDAAKDFAQGTIEMFKGLFGFDENEKQLYKEEEELRNSLAERTSEWEAYAQEVEEARAQLTASYAEQLEEESSALRENLDRATRDYEEFVVGVTSELEEIRQRSAEELDKDRNELLSRLGEKIDDYDAYAQEVTDKLATIREENEKDLERDLQNLQENLDRRREAYDEFVDDTIRRLSRIQEDLNEDLEDANRSHSRKLEDENRDYARDVEDISDDINEAQKKGDSKRVAELKRSLERRKEDHARAVARMQEDLVEQTEDHKRQAERQTSDLERELRERAQEWERTQIEFRTNVEETTAAHARQLAAQEKDLQESLARRHAELLNFEQQTLARIAQLEIDSAASLAREEGKLRDSLDRRTQEYEKYKADVGAALEALPGIYEAKLAVELGKLQASFNDKLAEYDKYKQGVETKLQELEDAHKTPLERIKGLFLGVFESAGNALLRFLGEEYFGKLFKKLNELLFDVLPKLGSKLIDIFTGGSNAAAGLAGNIANIQVPGWMTPTFPGAPGGGAKPPGGGVGGTASGVASGLMGTIGAVGSVVSAISGVIGNFQMHSMGVDLGRIEESTRYTAIAMIGPAGVLDTLRSFLPWLQILMIDGWYGENGLMPSLASLMTTVEQIQKDVSKFVTQSLSLDGPVELAEGSLDPVTNELQSLGQAIKSALEELGNSLTSATETQTSQLLRGGIAAAATIDPASLKDAFKEAIQVLVDVLKDSASKTLDGLARANTTLQKILDQWTVILAPEPTSGPGPRPWDDPDYNPLTDYSRGIATEYTPASRNALQFQTVDPVVIQKLSGLDLRIVDMTFRMGQQAIVSQGLQSETNNLLRNLAETIRATPIRIQNTLMLPDGRVIAEAQAEYFEKNHLGVPY